MSNWRQVMASVAPTLATALGGPLGGLAASVAGKILLGNDNAKPDEISDFVLANQSPATFQKLKEIESNLAKELRELDIESERIAAIDRDSARDRQAKTRDRMPGILAAAVFMGFFGILGALMFLDQIPEAAISPLNIMLGSLSTLVVQIGAYYFGSSKGSADKTDILKRKMET